MHPLFQKAGQLIHAAIGAAIEVHRLKGPGLLESIYEKCFIRELSLRQVAAVSQIPTEDNETKGPRAIDTAAGRPFGPFMVRGCAMLLVNVIC